MRKALPSRVLIAGCGYVGSCLGLHLVQEGHQVWGLRRQPESLPRELILLQADLTKTADLVSLPERLDFVIYAVAADGPTQAEYQSAYVVGMANLLEALERQGQHPRRIFFTSSTAVYERSEGEWVNEDTAIHPAKSTALCLLAGERALRRSSFPSTVVRLSGIYGPGRTRLIEQVRRGQVVCLEGPSIFTNRIHRDDCAGILRHLMSLEEPVDLYLGTDREPVEVCVVYRWLAGQLGLPPPPIKPRPPLAKDAQNNKRCSSDRLVRSGYEFLYPTFREGYGQLLKEGAVLSK